ncbi:MAG TPA: FtsW/RodA/SpoVE family cell cycle protein [Phycisphaerales bacterium]|nr:FtsW/RodA/SpoVE family cell cycle protein [Phycisphaerales bacterium]
MPYTRQSRSSGWLSIILERAKDIARNGGPAWLVVIASLALSLLGVYAIDVAESVQPHALGELGSIATRQLVFLTAGIMAAIVILLPNYRWYGYASWVLMACTIGLLIFLLIPFVPASIVRPRNGARAWIDLGAADLQPSEFAKIAYVLVLAWYLRFRKNHRTFLGLIPPAIITFIPVGLIMLQPDLGQSTLFIPTLFAVLVAAGAKLKHLSIIVLCACMAAPAAYPLLKPHQKQRIVGLLWQLEGTNTQADLDINMQSVTAQRMVGAGGFDGAGNAHSRMLLKYNALPERHTDMIYAVICSRFGLLGGVLTLALYAVWILGAVLTAGVTREPFGRLVIVGLTAFMAAQIFINVGMNLGLVPIIGITLPYLSHGGSSMLTVWLMTGLILNIALRRPRYNLQKSFEFTYEDD